VHRQAIVGQRWAWATTMARRASAAFFSVSSNSMGAHPPFQPATDWTEVQIDRLNATKDPLDRAQGFVGSHGRGIVERFNRKAGADDIDAVGCSLGGDLGAPPREVEGSISDIEIEMLGHCVLIEHGAELKRDLVAPRKRPRLRVTAAWMRARSRSVAASNSCGRRRGVRWGSRGP
jgi:hypothetical protein